MRTEQVVATILMTILFIACLNTDYSDEQCLSNLETKPSAEY